MNNDTRTQEERLNDLEKKINHIIKILGITSFNKEETEPPPIPTPLRNQAPTPVNHNFNKKYEATSEIKNDNPINLLPVLAVICFAMAGIFIVNLAINSGWLTPIRQWGLLSVFGISLVTTGLFFENFEKSYRSWDSALWGWPHVSKDK